METKNYKSCLLAYKGKLFNIKTVSATYDLLDDVNGLYGGAVFDKDVSPDELLNDLEPLRNKINDLALAHVEWLTRPGKRN